MKSIPVENGGANLPRPRHGLVRGRAGDVPPARFVELWPELAPGTPEQQFDEIKRASVSPVRTEVEGALDRLDLLLLAIRSHAEVASPALVAQLIVRRRLINDALLAGGEV